MAGLQRSVVSFRRQGSSGLVWDDRFISEEPNKEVQKEQDDHEALQVADVKAPRTIPSIKTIDRSRSNRGGGRGYRAKDTTSPAIEPPSPRVSACGFCSAFAKSGNKNQRGKPGKRRAR